MKMMDKYAAKDFFIYSITIGSAAAPIAPLQKASGSFGVQADSDFLWQKATLSGLLDTGSLISDADLTVLVTDTASGRELANIALPNLSQWGNAKLPFVLPQPKLFQASGNVQVSILNTGTYGATYNAIYVSFIGTKLFLK